MATGQAAAHHAAAHDAQAATTAKTQRHRRLFQWGFMLLFLAAPALNLLRFDLHEARLWVLGTRWSLGIGAFQAGSISAPQMAASLMLRGFLPVIVLAVVFLAVAYRYGRLYCGWLCPHFSMVEGLNNLLHRAIGKLSVWDQHRTPRTGPAPQRRWWPVFALACGLSGFAWAITLLTYLLPPAEIWGGLLHGTLTANQARFLLIASTVFTLEFAFARHLFCRFGCAVGLFQNLAWIANPRGMVVAFARERARDCKTCDSTRGHGAAVGTDMGNAKAAIGNACDNACPMRCLPAASSTVICTCGWPRRLHVM